MKNTIKPDKHDTTFDAQELLALVRIDIERGALEQALQKIKQLIANPEVPAEALALAGRLYAQLGLWDRAQDLFQRYLQLNPQAVTEAFQLGMVHFDGGRLDEAAKIWTELLQKQPNHPPALFYRSLVLAQQGKSGEARQGLDVLMKTAAADNLYFGRGKELLNAIEAQQLPTASAARNTKGAQPAETFRSIAKDAYKTEH